MSADEGEKKDDEGETSPLLQNVHFVAIDGKDMGVLWEIQPIFIIVYNPDISFVRQLEVKTDSDCLEKLMLACFTSLGELYSTFTEGASSSSALHSNCSPHAASREEIQTGILHVCEYSPAACPHQS